MTELKKWQKFALGAGDDGYDDTTGAAEPHTHTPDNLVPPRVYYRRMPKNLHPLVEAGHARLGLRLLDQIRDYTVNQDMLDGLRSAPMVRIRLNPPEQDLHDKLEEISGHNSHRIFLCAMLLAEKSPLTPAPPSTRHRTVQLQPPARDPSVSKKTTVSDDLPFFVSPTPSIYPNQKATFPSTAETLFLAADLPTLERHIQTLRDYLASDKIDQDERDLLEVCLSTALRTL